MTRFACLAAVVVFGLAVSAQAQFPSAAPGMLDHRMNNAPLPPGTTAPDGSQMQVGELTPTPSMWFYEQARRQYDDPQANVRANAEYRGAQRMQRMAARKWYGFSNARPIAAATPTHTTNSPQWSSGGWDSYRWTGGARPSIVVVPESPGSYGLR